MWAGFAYYMKNKLVYSIVGVLVIIAVLLMLNFELNYNNAKTENSKLKNQTNIEQNNPKINESLVLEDNVTQNLTHNEKNLVTIIGYVKHIVSECAPARSQPQQCVFFDLAILQTADNKYQLYNATFPYKQLENKQVKVTGNLVIPSKSKFVSVLGDLYVIKYSIVEGNNYTTGNK